MTVILVCLIKDQLYEEWIQKIRQFPSESYNKESEFDIAEEHFTTPSQSPTHVFTSAGKYFNI